jgi:hypothetical protein
MLDPESRHGRIDPFDKPATPDSGSPHEVMFFCSAASGNTDL